MHLTLEQQSGTGRGRREILSPGQSLRIGRTEWAEYSVPDDPRLSSIHFEIRWDGRRAQLRDLNSSNGTRVNGQVIDEVQLASGDVIAAGQTQFRVIFSAPEAVVETPQFVDSSHAKVADPPGPPVAGSTTPSSPYSVESAMAATLRDSMTPRSVSPRGVNDSRRPFSQGLADPHPSVRRAALLAAAWSRQSWLLDYCRSVAEQGVPESETEVWLYGVLATPHELPRIVRIGRAAQLGPRRLRLLGTFGHPGVIPDLLRAVHSPDVRTQLAAGAAFEVITGMSIDSTEKVRLPSVQGQDEDGDEFEQEFQEEVFLPDPQVAAKVWEHDRARLEKGTRWRRGHDVSRFPSSDVLMQLDLPSREEVCLRGHYERAWEGGPAFSRGS